MIYPDEQVLWMILYRDCLGSLKYIDILFPSEKEAYLFAVNHHMKDFLVATHEEFIDYRAGFASAHESELQYWRSRVARPYHENIELVEEVDEPEIREVAPPVDYTNLVPRKQSLFRPVFVGAKRPKPTEDEVDDVTIYERKDG